MSSNKQLLGCISVTSIQYQQYDTQGSAQQILQKLRKRKENVKVEIGRNIQKIQKNAELQMKRKELERTRQRMHKNVTKIQKMQELVRNLQVQLRQKAEQRMGLVFESQNLQLQLKQIAQKVVKAYKYDLGYQSSPKYLNLQLIKLQGQIQDQNWQMGIKTNIIKFITKEIQQIPSNFDCCEFMVENGLVEKLHREMLVKLGEENKRQKQVWVKYIRVLKELQYVRQSQNNHTKSMPPKQILLNKALKLKRRVRQIKQQIKQIKQTIGNCEIDIRIQQQNIGNLKHKNKQYSVKITQLKQYQQSQNNPYNINRVYQKELKQLQQAIRYFQIKNTINQHTYTSPPKRLKTMETVQTKYTDVLAKSSMFLSPKCKYSSSKKKLWK